MEVVTKINELTGGGADVVFECIGNDKTGPLAVELAGTAGKVVIVGIYEKESSFILTVYLLQRKL
ncbi:zinc-binding dehydrogenase [Desulfotruncus alcoholivorax]|uniref:zinc-binding dehydrogenase n=1 Tax=Desulfotruncus alcoholivorax TaxID=265477 RepID=UPI0004207AFA|nr:zinc-binding dehydrogenase [Desulfotruncus alcoholivorax]